VTAVPSRPGDADLAAIALEIGGAEFDVVGRGFDVDEVRSLLASCAAHLREMATPQELRLIAQDLETARFTPVKEGFDPLQVRHLLNLSATRVRAAAESLAPSSRPDPASVTATDLERLSTSLGELETSLRSRTKAFVDEAETARGIVEQARAEALEIVTEARRQAAAVLDVVQRSLDADLEEGALAITQAEEVAAQLSSLQTSRAATIDQRDRLVAETATAHNGLNSLQRELQNARDELVAHQADVTPQEDPSSES
jgi:cell division septum initiation protein DivIVA